MRFKFALAVLLGAGLSVGSPVSANETAQAAAVESSQFAPLPMSLSEPVMLADQPAPKLPSAGTPYRGGRGLITLQGMSGMFLNPTSGTLDQGQLTIQYCLLVDRFNLNSVVGHGLMAAYGVTDWLELGLFGTVAEINGVDRRILDDPIGVGGPFARVRLMKEAGMMPEVSIGGMFIDGSDRGDLLARAEGFIAASKSMPLDIDGTFRSLRAHLGIRYVGRHEAPTGQTDFALAYGGLELELPYSLYLIGEVSSNNLMGRADNDLPYAAGVQWKPNNVLGISLAYSNPEILGLRRGFWFGVGLNFKL